MVMNMDADTNAEAGLRLAIDFVPQGLAVFDADLRLVAVNSRYRELLGIPRELLRAGTPLYELALFAAKRGDYGPGEPGARAAERVEFLTNDARSTTQRLGNQGQSLEFHSSRLPDGGLVITLVDVAARVGAEAALEAANQSLEK